MVNGFKGGAQRPDDTPKATEKHLTQSHRVTEKTGFSITHKNILPQSRGENRIYIGLELGCKGGAERPDDTPKATEKLLTTESQSRGENRIY